MSGLCGWLSLENSSHREDIHHTITQMLAPLKSEYANKTKTFTESYTALGGVSIGDELHSFKNEEVIIIVYGQPRFRESTLNHKLLSDNFAEQFALEYKKSGAEALTHVTGAFALALINTQQNEVLLAVDRMGIFSLTYTCIKDCIVFASNSVSVNQHPRVKVDIDPQSLYNYIYFHIVPSPSTIYSNQNRLLPGSSLLFKEGKLLSHKYWKIEFQEQNKSDEESLKPEFINLLKRCVKTHCNGYKIGSFLSGGVDSSTVSGLVGEVMQSKASTYSIGFDAKGYDEIGYARVAAKHFHTNNHEYYVTPYDVLQSIPEIAKTYDQPFGNSSAIPTFYCAKLAKEDGIERIFAGDGGDELFGGNERYATQNIFSLYDAFPSQVRKYCIEPIVSLASPHTKILPLRKFVRYVEQASMPMPDRMESYNLLSHFGVSKVFNKDFTKAVNPQQPLTLLKQVYFETDAKYLVNRMLALDLKFTLADNDLPKVTRMCELAGVQVVFPLLEDELVEFSTRLPHHFKLKGTRLRPFYKESLRGFLPDKTIAKKKHGFGLPFGVWLNQYKPLNEFVRDTLNDLKRRDIIRPEFIDEVFTVHLSTHGGYYGTMIWILMMLEQWYQHHVDSRN